MHETITEIQSEAQLKEDTLCLAHLMTYPSSQIIGWNWASSWIYVIRGIWRREPPWCPLAGCKSRFTYQQVLGTRKQQQKEGLSGEIMQKIEMQQKKKEAVNKQPLKTSKSISKDRVHPSPTGRQRSEKRGQKKRHREFWGRSRGNCSLLCFSWKHKECIQQWQAENKIFLKDLYISGRFLYSLSY